MSSTNKSLPPDWSLYPYTPVKPLPFLFAGIILILGVANAYQSFIRYRWHRFGFIMTWASAVWLAGFICRAFSQYHTQDVGLYIAQYILIIMGPALYAASEIFILGRLFAYLPYLTPIHPGRVVSTFVIVTTVIEALTANGASRAASTSATPETQQQGLTLIKAAMVLQAVLELGFLSLTAFLHHRARKANVLNRSIRIMLCVLYVTSTMIFVRCVVRAVEAFEAAACIKDPLHRCGVVNTHEAYLWILEVANITLFVIILTIFPPGRFIPRSDKVYLDPTDGKTERLGPGFSKADKRAWWVTVVDPFDFAGIVAGKGKSVEPFWDAHNPIYVGQEVKDTRSRRFAAASDESKSDLA